MRAAEPLRFFLSRFFLPCWLAPCWLAVACSTEEPVSRELFELERLAFVPAASFKLVLTTTDPNADCSIKRSIVMDRFEFTLRDKLHYLGPGEGQDPYPSDSVGKERLGKRDTLAGFADDRLDRPAALNYHEALELATLRGMRIPRAKEWIHVAVGRKRVRYPWGSRPARFANTKEVELGRPLRVGTFENGRVEPFGCYDMLGNVWEWVADEAPSFIPQFEAIDGDVTSVMGGAYDSPLKEVFFSIDRSMCFHARTVLKETRDPTYGARMCADAEEYLWSKAVAWGSGPEARRRVRSVGRHWAEDFVARDVLSGILEQLLQRPDAPEGLSWLRDGIPGEPKE